MLKVEEEGLETAGREGLVMGCGLGFDKLKGRVVSTMVESCVEM